MTSIAIHGSRGYLGRELVRLLHRHPHVDDLQLVSDSQIGVPYAEAVPGFQRVQTPFISSDNADADVTFYATGHGYAAEHAPTVQGHVIDLSRDHRAAALEGNGWHYGLADIDPPAKGTQAIANPGCYPTASLLAALPALQNGLANGPLIVDGKSSISGAGATPREDLHFPAANEAVRAYKVLGHDHQAEIAGKSGLKTRFTPHLVPMGRGLLSTVYLQTDADAEEIRAAYAAAYQDTAFVQFGPEPDTSHVARTNHAQVAVDVDDGILVARCACDNLQKGGSGQAVQNLNHIMGWAPDAGLDHVGGGP